MKAAITRKIARSAIVLVLLYVIGGIILFFIQDALLFHPVPLKKNYRFAFSQPFTEVNVAFEAHNLNIVTFAALTPRKGIVLFFHGNMENVEHYNKYPQLFTRNGYDVWMIDYPGFGKTTGKRSEEIMYQQAEVMYGLAWKQIHPDSIIVYGKSLGTGPAAWLAAHQPCKKLLLETPYYNMEALAKSYFPIYPVRALIKYHFPINRYLGKISVPITILHGTEDNVVPYRQGKRLASEHTNIELVTIDKGGHNNLYDFDLFQKKIDSILMD